MNLRLAHFFRLAMLLVIAMLLKYKRRNSAASFSERRKCLCTERQEWLRYIFFVLQISCKEANGYRILRTYNGSFWSLKSEMEWFCEDKHYADNVLSAQSAGMVVTTLVLMQLSDR